MIALSAIIAELLTTTEIHHIKHTGTLIIRFHRKYTTLIMSIIAMQSRLFLT